ncbi:MAG: hypothetical protein Q9224_007478, partial [Gallowayella concinna]
GEDDDAPIETGGALGGDKMTTTITTTTTTTTTMSILSGCMTVASAAIADAGIDIADLVSGGVAAIVPRLSSSSSLDSPHHPNANANVEKIPAEIILDPCPSEHSHILAICVIGYLRSRDQITEIWTRGNVDSGLLLLSDDTEGKGKGDSTFEMLMDKAVEAAVEARRVLEAALMEAAEFKLRKRDAEEAGLKG